MCGIVFGYFLGKNTKEELVGGNKKYLNAGEIFIFLSILIIFVIQLLIHKTILVSISLAIILVIVYVRDFNLALVRYGVCSILVLVSIPYSEVWLLMCSLLFIYGIVNGSNYQGMDT